MAEKKNLRPNQIVYRIESGERAQIRCVEGEYRLLYSKDDRVKVRQKQKNSSQYKYYIWLCKDIEGFF